MRGKLAGLLELGAGFQQDLTGRENIYLNGSLLGMSKKEVDKVFDAIVDFSELEEFIDGPVKFYSSGMYVRLGFAVAVNVDPDILVIDEVLAVGDERFQRKCIDRVKLFQQRGPHHPAGHPLARPGALHLRPGHRAEPRRRGGRGRSRARRCASSARACSRRGRAGRDRPERRRGARRSRCRWAQTRCRPSGADHLRRTALPGSKSVAYMATGDDLTIGVGYHASIATDDVVFSLELRDERRQPASCGPTPTSSGVRFDLPRRARPRCNFDIDDMPLLDGTFTFSVGILSRGGVLYDWREPAGHVRGHEPGQDDRRSCTLPVQACVDAARARDRHRCDGARGRAHVSDRTGR